ncbi:MAG: preprotein translocase subunit YajC [Thermoguttaceae bacterium]|nr:preprotein translocase subunit YajC [Thermoguttaceae bacterium]MBQ9812080.1 preprotein translocase subunit YajC [Thermoguttaceae bacterium]
MESALLNAFVNAALPLFADAAAPAADAPQNPGGGPFNLVMMVFFVLIAIYLLFILPAKSRDKQAQKLVDSIKINDRVLTTSGIIGTVYSMDRQAGEIVLRVDESNNVKMRFALSSIYFVYNKEAAEKGKDESKDKDKGAKK